MSNPMFVLCIGLIMLFILQLMDKWQQEKNHREEVKRLYGIAEESHEMLDTALYRIGDEREQWRTERQQLLDRIQAPTFGEYKQAEIKQFKVQNGIKEPAPLEPL